jgi:hypothetical protein
VPYSLLLDIEWVNWFCNVPAHLPKVHLGTAVHHSVADMFRASGEQLVLMSLMAALYLPLSVSLMRLTRPLHPA